MYEIRCSVQLFILLAFGFSNFASAYEIVPEATIADSQTTLMGVNHIGLSVKELDKALAFYQQATGFEVIHRETVKGNGAADRLFGIRGIEYETAVLEAPNMLFELTSFSHNSAEMPSRMQAQGPGMTHTCFQSPASRSGYEKFVRQGADVLSRGSEPIDLLGQGVTYAYVYDPEGNMIELEQLDFERLGRDPRKPEWIENDRDLWMTQVALVTHDLERLTNFYAEVMGFPPYREAEIDSRPTFDDVADIENLALNVSWFRMSPQSKTLELWEYVNPRTSEFTGSRDVTDFGYSYSIEVGDIQAEYERMKALGVQFISDPIVLGDFWQVYANDIDGNVFSLRQAVNPDSPYSIPQLEG